MALPKVVILGAGFGGLTAARALSKHAEVVLIDRHNFQTFLLLYSQARRDLEQSQFSRFRERFLDARIGVPELL